MSDLEQDRRAREFAVDPSRSILLQAPAGSGKTTVLTQRLLRLLAEVDEPEHILAITFTRKAAAEMRARVLKALRGEIDGQSAQSSTLRDLSTAVLARSRERQWNLLDLPGRLRIQTIDAFNSWLARQLPVSSKSGGMLNVADYPLEAYERAARSALVEGDRDEALADAIELLFERLDNRWSRVERLLTEMLRQRGHWLAYVFRQGDVELVARINESLSHIVGEHLEQACVRIGPQLRKYAECLPEVSTLDAHPGSLRAWQRVADLLLTQDAGEWRKSISVKLGPEFADASVKESLKRCIEQWRLSDVTRQTLHIIRDLPPAALPESQAEAIAALARVLRSAAAHLQEYFAATGEVDHTYVAGAAREALTSGGEPTDLALRLGFALRHILVDEFQDTAVGQFDLLNALTATWEPGDGRTLFVVGDPMQSIYQFREAEVGLFLRARDEGVGTVRLEPLKLLRNFRSVPDLIGWANETFADVFPAEDDLRASAVSFTPSLAAREEVSEPPVRLTIFESSGKESESLDIATRIANLRANDGKGTIAVLVASRSHAVPIISALHESAVAVIGVKLVPLRDLPIVGDLIGLLRALHHPGDRTAWLTVLRAPWCGATLATLTALSPRRDHAVVWERLSDESCLLACEASQRMRIERVRLVLEDALASREQEPPAQWLESTWLRLGGPDAYPAADLPHARALFEAIDERWAQGRWSGPRGLEALLSDLWAQPVAAQNPVQVMTIHQAKGLEFDHVFLPALGTLPQNDQESLLGWLELPRRGGGSDLLMAPVTPTGDDGKAGLAGYLKRLRKTRTRNERSRLLYVAVTRARQSLHLSASVLPDRQGKITPRPGTLLKHLWAGRGTQFVRIPDEQQAFDFKPPAPQLRRLNSHWKLPELEPAPGIFHLPIAHRALGTLEFSWAGETVRHIGTVVHAELERFAALEALPPEADLESARSHYRDALHRLGVPGNELEEGTSTVIAALKQTLGDERGRWIFDRTHRESHSELALTGIADGRLVSISIDRSFVDRENVRWVIDFKTSRHKGGDLEAFLASELERYRAQLEGYVALARSLGPQPVRAALYFPLLGAFRELPTR